MAKRLKPRQLVESPEEAKRIEQKIMKILESVEDSYDMTFAVASVLENISKDTSSAHLEKMSPAFQEAADALFRAHGDDDDDDGDDYSFN